MNPNAGTENSFLSLHGPRGASAYFALGLEGYGGGFGHQEDYIDLKRDVFIGYKEDDSIRLLPYYQTALSASSKAFTQDVNTSSPLTARKLTPVKRQMKMATDLFEAGDVSFELLTPVSGIPDPESSDSNRLKDAITPAILCRLSVDNRAGKTSRCAFFAVQGLRGAYPLAPLSNGRLCGVGCKDEFGFAVDSIRDPDATLFGDFDLLRAFNRPALIEFALPSMSGLSFNVKPGELRTVTIALGWFKPWPTTRPKPMKYYYTRFFESLPDVLAHALVKNEEWWKEGAEHDAMLAASGLNRNQQFIIAQALRSYWASTMLFDDDGRSRWVVNEGSFMMMNTFDLTVDQLFFEMRHMPWAVRNELDYFVSEYSYHDHIHFPGQHHSHPGGIAFTHDQGVFNTWSKQGSSCYEIPDQEGCFSYMTHEELVNWICCAGVYFSKAEDVDWLRKHENIFIDILASMQNRDNPDPAMRDGVMDLDSDRCGLSSEITTYDSLDPSLGQARRNTYLAVKCWAGYLALAEAFKYLGRTDLEKQALSSASLSAETIASAYNSELGYIPAILDGKNSSAIIPAIEGLVFPLEMGLIEAISESGPYGNMISKLKQHLKSILKPGKCLFEDMGWKLSDQNTNSWASKIFLCQHVARAALGMDFGKNGEAHDRAHADWWRCGCASNPGIDQIHSGKAPNVGFHYPRAVTSILWLK